MITEDLNRNISLPFGISIIRLKVLIYDNFQTMRLFNFFFLFMMGSYTLIAQDTNESSPASLRATKITAKWTDRANVKDGGANPGGQYVQIMPDLINSKKVWIQRLTHLQYALIL